MWQDRLIYFPQRAPVAAWAPPGLAPWPSETDVRGLVASPIGPPRATAVVFHGNAGHAGHRAAYAQLLTQLGLRVILAEYPGYGPREGALGEASLVADAVRTLELAAHEAGAPLVVIGESLGAGVAAAAAAGAAHQVAGLLLFTPWNRLDAVAAHHYPLVPVRWLLRDRYDSVAHLTTLGKPVWVAVAERDDIVPPQFGRALYDALPGPRRWVEIRSAGHNDWWHHMDRPAWQSAIDFVLAGGR
ncbi:MAG TPA: alpha/beta hydrolase [Burkholderiaceae bacterium]|nr:alpha/beta hydrolase [Burkholderiaceae bacterium]